MILKAGGPSLTVPEKGSENPPESWHETLPSAAIARMAVSAGQLSDTRACLASSSASRAAPAASKFALSRSLNALADTTCPSLKSAPVKLTCAAT